ncbi:LEM domain-containing protein 1 [Budorcas taxicolor]|uniref:LEM domain-containing protein 1 n=1 Tax=Budorcas taxicolor TaxID=37181 RepID=UPI0022839C66|nr:LEM domain-containing protein 1 [Budorcas taxicolor]
MVEVTCLSDAELQNKLNTLGFPPGPILPSTRKVYEKKLVQLLVSTLRAPPKKNRPGELSRARDDDGSEGTIRSQSYTAKLLCSQAKPSRFSAGSFSPERCKTSTSKPKAVEIFCSDSNRTKGRRRAARVSDIRCEALRSLKEKACRRVNRGAGDRSLEAFPMRLMLAVLGIFIIVIFVYITMENKSLFG